MNQHYLNQEEKEELDDLSITLSYQAIKFSPLWKLLDNELADKFALELAEGIRARVSLKIDQKIESIEAQRAKEAA